MGNIVIVESEARLARELCDLIVSAGHEAIYLINGTNGLKTINQELPDLVILDTNLSDMSGFSLCQAIRSNPKTRTTLIILIGRSCDEEVQVRAFNSGCDDYVVKPFSSKELVARIGSLLRRRNGMPYKPVKAEQILQSGNLRLYLMPHKIERDGKEIHLSKVEFDILSLLMQNNNRILSKKILVESIWGSKVAVFDNTLNVHIHSIRNKIEDNPSIPKRIVTIRGVGFLFQG